MAVQSKFCTAVKLPKPGVALFELNETVNPAELLALSWKMGDQALLSPVPLGVIRIFGVPEKAGANVTVTEVVVTPEDVALPLPLWID